MSKLTPRQNLGRTLRALRLIQQKTQWDLARAMNYTTAQFISNWERGISVPPEEVIIPLAHQLGVKPLELANMILTVPENELDIRRKRVLQEIQAALQNRKGKRP